MDSTIRTLRKYVTKREANNHPYRQVIRLPKEDTGMTNNIVRVPNIHVKRFGRRKAVIITNNSIEGSPSILRYVMGGSSLRGLNSETIALDYDGVNDLNMLYRTDTDLQVRPANWLDEQRWLLTHADLNVRLSYRLGVIALGLGVLSVVLTIV
jgi:hypothetical protein